jgi:hypothetical protein
MNAILDQTMTATKGMLRELKREELPEVQGGHHTRFHDVARFHQDMLDMRVLRLLRLLPGPVLPPPPWPPLQ